MTEERKNKSKSNFKVYSLIAILALVVGIFGGVFLDNLSQDSKLETFINKILPKNLNPKEETESGMVIDKTIINEESVVIDTIEKASPSVVTVGMKKTQKIITDPFANLFDPFGFFGRGNSGGSTVQEQEIEQDIGTGFVITKDGLVVTNKHVVSDTAASYKIISKDNKEYEVKKIYRDPTLDLAILQTEAIEIPPIILGDSDNLKVGQTVIAIGTALGEFRNTVTTGVISGLGRGIVAGDSYGYSSEKLENVIQTDAAINPGNSGGPLLNIGGQVIGVNVATSTGADNVSFAVPINIVKEAIENFYNTGKFDRAYLGVQYKMISRDLSILNEIPEGAYIVTVLEGSPAFKAGLQKGDIITKIDGKNFADIEGGLAELIKTKKASIK